MCEKAYRRGAQHAVAFKLSEDDAAWFRTYGHVERNGDGGFFIASHAMPENGFVKNVRGVTKRLSPRQYSRLRQRKAVELLRQELGGDAYEWLHFLFLRTRDAE
jgi:hypothetical protein